jgi:hypothetical protein
VMDMDANRQPPRVSIVVGEGEPSRRGLLRFVLEGEGFVVVAESTTTVELVHALAIHRPDVVVLDDAIGTTAIAVAHEMVPESKLVLVWPEGVIPIGGDARVAPTELLRDLGAAVEHVLGLDVEGALMGTVSALPVSAGPADRAEHAAFGHHPSTFRPMADVIPGPGLPRAVPERDDLRDEPIVADRDPAPLLILPLSRVIERDDGE